MQIRRRGRKEEEKVDAEYKKEVLEPKLKASA